jgi:hypothetical protein
MTHTVPLGSDPAGNISRIDNALEKINTTLETSEARLETLYSQVENAKIELAKPFPQEAVLTEKSARLAELDSLLSLDGKDEPNADTPAVDAPTSDTPIADADINIDGVPEKVLAVKQSNTELSGDKTTPQIPQTVTPIKEGSAVISVKPEAKKEDVSDTQPPQDKPKKKSYDER